MADDPSRLERLAVDRMHLEAAIADASAGVLPALIREHRAVLAEIAELTPPEQKGTPLDQLAERRRARGAETKGVDAAEGSPGSR